MRKIIIITFSLLFLVTSSSFSLPNFWYNGVAYNTSGQIIVSPSQVEIRAELTDGTNTFIEEFLQADEKAVNTDEFGIVAVEIGTGHSVSGTLSSILMKSGTRITVKTRIVGTSTWVIISGQPITQTYMNSYVNMGSVTETDPIFSVSPAASITDAGSGQVITSAERTKLSGIAAGAEVNVNADWTAVSGDAQILNKPDLSVYLTKSNNLSDLNSASTARTNLGLGTIATQNANAVAITGGAIDGTTLGLTTPAAGKFLNNLTLVANAAQPRLDLNFTPGQDIISSVYFTSLNNHKFAVGLNGSTHPAMPDAGFMWAYDASNLRFGTNNIQRLVMESDNDIIFGTPADNVDVSILGTLNVSNGITGDLTGNVTGNVTGNAGTVTNGVYTNGSYANPAWITSLAYSKLTGTPTSLPPSGSAGGDLTGTYPNPTIAQKGATTGQILSWNGSAWVPVTDNSPSYTAGTGININGSNVISSTLGADVDLASEVTGTLPVAHGGTGATTFTAGYLKANGTSAFTTVATIPNTDITGLGTMATAATSDYYTQTNLQTSGQASVHWDNLTNKPTFTTGTVTNFSAGDLSPIFTTSEATTTTTPALSFTLSDAAAHTFLGNNTGSTAAPAYVSLTDADVPDALTISGGTVNNSVIGGTTPAAGTFTTVTGNTSIKVKETASSPTNYTTFVAGDQSTDITYTLPTTAPTAGQVLTTNSTTPTNLEWKSMTEGLDSLVEVFGGDGNISGTDYGSINWTKASNAKYVKVIAIGAGGGGGGGQALRCNTTALTGAGGGGGGAFVIGFFKNSNISSSVTITIGKGGTGGAGILAPSNTCTISTSNNGNAGGNTSFGNYLVAQGGGGGIAAKNSATMSADGGSGATNSRTAQLNYYSKNGFLINSEIFISPTGNNGGSAAANDGNPIAIVPPEFAYDPTTTGGGYSGYCTATAVFSSSAGGSCLGVNGGSTGSSGTNSNGSNGSNGNSSVDFFFGTGGGGGGSTWTNGSTDYTAGNGGKGGYPGGGGGAGGSALRYTTNGTTGPTSGSGGDGANGRIIVITYY